MSREGECLPPGFCVSPLLRCPASAGGDEAPWHLPTAATRSARFIRRRRRSHRSPSRLLRIQSLLLESTAKKVAPMNDTYNEKLVSNSRALRYSNADVNCRFASVCEDIWNHLQRNNP